jgi:tetratricopeptide (TPR) repeat protein
MGTTLRFTPIAEPTAEKTAAAPAAPASWRLTILAAGLVVAAAVAAYHNSFAGPFIGDDGTSIVKNRTIRRLWLVYQVLSPPSSGETVSGRPLLNLSLAINYAQSGLEVWSYHLTNLAIHVAAALLLFGIVRRTFLMPALCDRFGRAAAPLALASALLWTVHPLQTESVTYIIQRAESLMGFFYLLTLYCVIRGAGGTVPFFAADKPIPRPTVPGKKGDCPPWSALLWYAAAVLACLLGMACKEVMATAPLVVLLYDRTFLAGSLAEAWRRRWGLYLALAATWALLAYLVVTTGLFGRQREFGAPNLWGYACSQPGVILHYLQLSVWPSSLCLGLDWPVAGSFREIFPAALVVGLLVAATVWGLVGRKAWGFLGAWFFLILAPTSSILPLNQLAFEHRMYLSLAAVAVLVVAGGYALGDRLLPRPAVSGRGASVLRWAAPAVMLAAVLTALGCATVARNSDYQSSLAIWQDIVSKHLSSPRAHNNLGRVLGDAGRTDEAIEHYREALRLKPDYAEAHYNLASALARSGRSEEASEHYQRLLQLEPDNAEAHHGLGRILAGMGKTDEAIEHYHQALEASPLNAEVHNSLGSALAVVGRFSEAIEHLNQALWLKPDYPEADRKLGGALAAIGETAEAIAHYDRALELTPDSTAALHDLSWLLATREEAQGGDPARALRLAERLCELSGQENASCLDTLAAAYAAAGRFADAIVTAERAMQLAESSRQEPLAKLIRSRLELYRAGQPYRQGPRPTQQPN